MTGRDLFSRFKPVIGPAVKILAIFPPVVRKILLWPLLGRSGKLGYAARYIFYKAANPRWGDNVLIAENVVIKHPDKLELGSNVSIHQFCYIDAQGGVEIGDDVSIAHGSSILSFEHGWQSPEPIKYNPCTLAPVTIASDVWLGCGVRVLAGASIGSRSIVAAGAVVKGTHGGGVIIGGVPARQIGVVES